MLVYIINSYIHVLPDEFLFKLINLNLKKHGGSVKLILKNLLSTRDYAVFYPVLVYIIIVCNNLV